MAKNHDGHKGENLLTQKGTFSGETNSKKERKILKDGIRGWRIPIGEKGGSLRENSLANRTRTASCWGLGRQFSCREGGEGGPWGDAFPKSGKP